LWIRVQSSTKSWNGVVEAYNPVPETGNEPYIIASPTAKVEGLSRSWQYSFIE
jgi:hypothetical protein